MTLQDLLDTLRTDILRDTSDAVEGDDPRLWSTATLVRYLNEAQRVFVKKSLVLRSKLTLNLVALQKEYDLDAAVFAVISARYMGNSNYQDGQLVLNSGLPSGTTIVPPSQVDLGRVGHSDIQTYQYAPDSRYWDVNRMDRLPPGLPLTFDTDEYVDTAGVMVMRFYPMPSADYAPSVVEMRVCVLPTKLDSKDLNQEPDVSEDYQLQLLDYVAFKCFSTPDTDGGNPQLAQTFKDQFDRNAEIARREMLRKMFTPQAWGFGRNGFSYVGN